MENKFLILVIIIWNHVWLLGNAFVSVPNRCFGPYVRDGRSFVRGKKQTENVDYFNSARKKNRILGVAHESLELSESDGILDLEPYQYQFQPISDSSQSGGVCLGNGEEFPSDEELARIPDGRKGGHKIVKILPIHILGNDSRTHNITLQEALCALDPVNYPSLTRARKACRKGFVLIHQGPIEGGEKGRLNAFKSKKCVRGRVGDSVYPGDAIGIQAMMGTFKKKRCYPFITYSRPRFALPVLYEDDHMAIVDKPAGIGMYGKRKSRSGSTSRRTVRDVLPYCLTPPAKGTTGQCLKRPMAVHRLDTPTSGLLVVAKTKVAMDSLYKQFAEHKVTKTYTAIVNGIPQNCQPLTTDPNNEWNIVDYPLGGKQAITTWRILKAGDSLNAKDGTLSLVEVQPRTGRYHQIRRHMAWICRRPLVGDNLYAGGLQATRFRRNGLYLCSNGILLDHPAPLDIDTCGSNKMIRFSDDKTTLQVSVTKPLPKRFEQLVKGENAWANRVDGIIN